MQFTKPRLMKFAVITAFSALTFAYVLIKPAMSAIPQHEHHQETKPPAQPTNKPPQEPKPGQPDQPPHDMSQHDMSNKDGAHAGHDMANMSGGHDTKAHNMNAMMKTVIGGPFQAMAAIGSGTSRRLHLAGVLLHALQPGRLHEGTGIQADARRSPLHALLHPGAARHQLAGSAQAGEVT
jgi:hypothetical protein